MYGIFCCIYLTLVFPFYNLLMGNIIFRFVGATAILHVTGTVCHKDIQLLYYY